MAPEEMKKPSSGELQLYKAGLALLDDFAKHFKQPMLLSLIARDPTNPDNELIISSDEMGELINALARMYASGRDVVPRGES